MERQLCCLVQSDISGWLPEGAVPDAVQVCDATVSTSTAAAAPAPASPGALQQHTTKRCKHIRDNSGSTTRAWTTAAGAAALSPPLTSISLEADTADITCPSPQPLSPAPAMAAVATAAQAPTPVPMLIHTADDTVRGAAEVSGPLMAPSAAAVQPASTPQTTVAAVAATSTPLLQSPTLSSAAAAGTDSATAPRRASRYKGKLGHHNKKRKSGWPKGRPRKQQRTASDAAAGVAARIQQIAALPVVLEAYQKLAAGGPGL